MPGSPGGTPRHEETLARLRLAEAALARLYEDGTISAATRQRLQRGLDLEATRLSDEQH
ncbi:MAG TPA: hypothetical protein VMV17_00255 [Streptosporangiaceae bacterium]|nr:hypothetical protein [Streptosporangiaceae bacterium]